MVNTITMHVFSVLMLSPGGVQLIQLRVLYLRVVLSLPLRVCVMGQIGRQHYTLHRHAIRAHVKGLYKHQLTSIHTDC